MFSEKTAGHSWKLWPVVHIGVLGKGTEKQIIQIDYIFLHQSTRGCPKQNPAKISNQKDFSNLVIFLVVTT